MSHHSINTSEDLIEAPICKSSNVRYLVITARTNFGLRQLLRSQQKEEDHTVDNDEPLSVQPVPFDPANQSVKQSGLKTQMLFLIGFDSKETQNQKNKTQFI